MLHKASGLCRAWRKTLVLSRTLWIHVRGPPQFVDLCLSRSASLPLRVTLSDGASPQVIKSLKSHLSRVRSLRICLPASKIHSVLDELSTPSPILQSFDVEIPLTKSGKPPTTPKKLLKQWSTSHLPHIFPENPTLTELYLRNIPLAPAFLNLTSVTTATLHHSDWTQSHILNFLSANKNLEKLSISGKMDHTPKPEPVPHPIISLPRLKLLVLSNMDPNDVLRHLRVPRGAHLELNCDPNLPLPNPNLKNLLLLEDWCYTHEKVSGVLTKTLTSTGPSGSVRVKWVTCMPWVEFFAPFAPSRARKLHLRNIDTEGCRTPGTLEALLESMNHLEVVIIDGAFHKLPCAILARRGPAPICPFLHTVVYCHAWNNFISYSVGSVAKCRYEAPGVPPLKRLIIATNVHLPSTTELRDLSFYVDSLELRMTTQVPETWEEPSTDW